MMLIPIVMTDQRPDEEESDTMDMTQKLGILIFTGVPAIMGGGIVYGLTHGFTPVIVYEVLLYLAVIAFCLKK